MPQHGHERPIGWRKNLKSAQKFYKHLKEFWEDPLFGYVKCYKITASEEAEDFDSISEEYIGDPFK